MTPATLGYHIAHFVKAGYEIRFQSKSQTTVRIQMSIGLAVRWADVPVGEMDKESAVVEHLDNLWKKLHGV